MLVSSARRTTVALWHNRAMLHVKCSTQVLTGSTGRGRTPGRQWPGTAWSL